VKTFKARTVDSRGGVSGWTSHTIVIDIPPVLSVSALGDYGTVVVTETKDRTITITNTGGGTLNVTGIADISASPHFVCTSGCPPFSLAGGVSSPPVTIRFTAPASVPLPYPPGALPSETIRVTASNAVNSPQDVSAWATIIPVISINPGPLDFGSVIITKYVDKDLTIINNSSTITVDAGNISVPAGSPFSCASSCAYGQILPGGRTTVTMRYKPTVVTPAGGPGDAGVGTLISSPTSAPQDNTGDMIGKGLPLTFKVIEK
jgi:hypothetical protein